MELVEERCRAHPMLLDAVRHLGEYSEDLEQFDPRSKKSAFFYTGPESLKRAEVTRHLKQLENMDKKKNLVVLPAYRKPYSKYLVSSFREFFVYAKDESNGEDEPCIINNDETDFAVLDIPFCLIPLELDEVYPLSQSDAPRIHDKIADEFARDFLIDFAENYDNVLIHPKVVDELELDYIERYEHPEDVRYKKDDIKKLKAIADYQFGKGAGDALFTGKIKIEKSKKTGKIRHVFDGNQNIVNMRASDSFLILSKLGAKRLATLDGMRNKVMIDNSVEEFARDGKSVFAKFVKECDENIRSNDEVLIVNEEGELLAFGKALLNHKEIMDFNTGQAIKTRKGFKK